MRFEGTPSLRLVLILEKRICQEQQLLVLENALLNIQYSSWISIRHLQHEDRNCDLSGRVDLSLTLCADVLTVGGFWPKSYAAGNRMSSSDWLTFLFSADCQALFIVYYTIIFSEAYTDESSKFVDWHENDENLMHCIWKIRLFQILDIITHF